MHHRTLIDTNRLRIRYQRRERDSFMGRFGGGWQWKVGVQHGGGTTLVSLLVAEVRIDRNTKPLPAPWWRERAPMPDSLLDDDEHTPEREFA